MLPTLQYWYYKDQYAGTILDIIIIIMQSILQLYYYNIPRISCTLYFASYGILWPTEFW